MSNERDEKLPTNNSLVPDAEPPKAELESEDLDDAALEKIAGGAVNLGTRAGGTK